MQRKNYLLKKHRHRSGMAMIMAIAIVVIISTILALSLSLTAQTTKRTSDLYLYEQSILLSKSAAEYGLLQISKFTKCNVPSANLNFTHNKIYDINISIRHVYSVACGADDYVAITTPQQDGSVLMDITVTVPKDRNVSSETIRYFRRSIQKL